jgi:lactam utilization protein B
MTTNADLAAAKKGLHAARTAYARQANRWACESGMPICYAPGYQERQAAVRAEMKSRIAAAEARVAKFQTDANRGSLRA